MGGTGRPLGKTFFLHRQRRHPELPKIPTYLPYLRFQPLPFLHLVTCSSIPVVHIMWRVLLCMRHIINKLTPHGKSLVKLGSLKCDALLPLELWGTCAQHPIGNGEVIGCHHVYWSSTKGVAIANGTANRVIMNDSDLSPSTREDVTKWAKGFDSKKLQTIGQSKRVIDFQTFLDTNPNEWKYDQEYQMDVSFQGLGNPVTHKACVDYGTKKLNEDFLSYKCNQKSKITSH